MVESKKCLKCQREHKSKFSTCSSCYFSKIKIRNNFKLENLEDSRDIRIDPSIIDIFEKITKTKDDKIKYYLKELLIIKLVTDVEINFTSLMSDVYFRFDHKLKELFPNDSFRDKSIEKIREISKSTAWDDEKDPKVLKPTKNPYSNLEGNVIATSFNLQNLDTIDHIFSVLTGINFLQTIKDLTITHSHNLKNQWDEIENLFELRHQIIHAGKKVELNEEELLSIINLIKILIDESFLFFYEYYDWYDLYLEYDQSFLEPIVSKEEFDKIINLMKKNEIK